MTTVVWLRDDLRLSDNPALSWAAERGDVCLLYVHNESSPGFRKLGGAQKWWLRESLNALADNLRALGGSLTIRQGNAQKILAETIKTVGATAVAWNRIYAQPAMTRDTALKTALKDQGLEVQSFNANLIHEPTRVTNKTGGQFKVFTPFWKSISAEHIAEPIPTPDLRFAPALPSDRLDFDPSPVNWAAGWEAMWQPGETGAKTRLSGRLDSIFDGYGTQRDIPSVDGTSKLSPHLRFGEISPRQVWHTTLDALRQSSDPQSSSNAWSFLREIGWREFSHYLLYHFPNMQTQSWREEFDAFPWDNNQSLLDAWQRGQTGYPVVDAGMRQLWQTGWMHNRVRMITASFLIKHCLVDWRHGESWFWDTLVDACPASNTCSWQWVAGSGADASPYFRVFNPFTQGEKFDHKGEYVRRWVPELASLNDKQIHQPWEVPDLVLRSVGIRLGETYPKPVVDHKTARKQALAAYETIKKKAA